MLFLVLSNFFVIYPGFGTQAVAYLAIYYLHNRSFLLFSLSFLLVIAQGKRSILFSLLATLIFASLLRRTSLLIAIFISAIAIASVFTCFFWGLEFYDLYSLPGMDRIRFINPFSSSFDLALGSSGRFDEISSAFSLFAEQDINWLLGAGFGFSYVWEVSYGEFYTEVKGYLHSVPLMLVILFGLPAAITFYLFSLNLVSQVLRNGGPNNESNSIITAKVISSSFLFFLISGAFSLNSLSDPLGWVFMGLCLAMNIINNDKSIYKRVGEKCVE